MKFVDFNDNKIPIGKRKVAYIKYLMHQHGYELITAQKLANRRFGFEIKYPKLIFLWADYGRAHQASFTGHAEIIQGYEDYVKRAGRVEFLCVDCASRDSKYVKNLKEKYEADGYKVIYTSLLG